MVEIVNNFYKKIHFYVKFGEKLSKYSRNIMEKTRAVVWNNTTHDVYRVEVRNIDYELVYIGSDFLWEINGLVNFSTKIRPHWEEALEFFNNNVKYGSINLTKKSVNTQNSEKYSDFVKLFSKTPHGYYENPMTYSEDN